MEDSKVKLSIGNILIPLIASAIGLIPFAYDKLSQEPKAVVTTTAGLDVEKKNLALLSYQEGMSLYNKGLFEEAKISLKAALNQGGIVETYYPLARCYMNGRVKDYEKFKFYCEEGIEKGDLKCHFGLCGMKKSAEQGDAFAQNNLGVMYHNGVGVKADHVKAKYWFQKAADQGNKNALKNIKMDR